MSGWTEARVELLKKLWADGLSCSQIATEVGDGLTRNAVISKIHRIGLSGRITVKANPKPRAPRPVRSAPIHVQPITPSPIEDIPAEATDIDPATDADIPVAQRKTVLELSDSTCRWPVGTPGQPGFFFCGGLAVDGRPYCGPHCQKAFIPASRVRTVYVPQRRH